MLRGRQRDRGKKPTTAAPSPVAGKVIGIRGDGVWLYFSWGAKRVSQR
ncbi:hypothetical protein O5699_01190 [Escherichia coli]|nr:hypothetical protein [Escherichia coli]